MATITNSVVSWSDTSTLEAAQTVTMYDDNTVDIGSQPAPIASVQAPPFLLGVYEPTWGGNEITDQLSHSAKESARETFHKSELLPLGDLSENYVKDVVRGSIYCSPTEIRGFFAEGLFTTVVIWNAKYVDNVINDRTVIDEEGTLMTPSSFPLGIGADLDKIYDLTVYANGPGQQDTTYTFDISGELFPIYISGIRILPFTFPIDWDDGYKLTLLHDTIIQDNTLTREQRRPFQSRMYKRINVKILLDTLEKQDIFYHWADMAQDKILAMPLYQEACFTAADIVSGQSNVVVREEISSYKFLPESSFVLVVDHENNYGEAKRVSSINIGTKTIYFENNIVAGFDKDTTVIYPVCFVTVDSIDFEANTDMISGVTLQFSEFRKEI